MGRPEPSSSTPNGRVLALRMVERVEKLEATVEERPAAPQRWAGAA
jgi:hypothetical protein